MSSFVALHWKSVLTHVGVGMGAASFWRGAWYILDDHLFPNDRAASALSSWSLGVVGIAASQGLVEKCEKLQQQGGRIPLKVARFGALYTIAVSCVLVWRGTWLGWDVLYEYNHPQQSPCKSAVQATAPGHLSTSGVVSHVLAVAALVGTGLFASVLAPPAANSVIRDFTVKAGIKPYKGPAGKLVELFWNPKNPSAAHAIVARNYRTHASSITTQRNSRKISTSRQQSILERYL